MFDKIKGGLFGLLIGDAVGVPYEFNSADRLPAYHLIDMNPPSNFVRTYPNIDIGTWSDDGAQALCLLASLLQCQKLDQTDLANRFSNWYRMGYMALDYQVFDVGIQTATALNRYQSGISVSEIASSDESSNGNGSLMRSLSLALWHKGSDAQLIDDAFQQSHITHAHVRSKLCCAIYCLWAKKLLKGQAVDVAWLSSIQVIVDHFKDQPILLEEIHTQINIEDSFEIKGSGYVVDCLLSAKFALQQSTYVDVVKSAIALGNDTDTTACVAGGLAGIIYGYNAIPAAWKNMLRGHEMVDPLLEQLIIHLKIEVS